MPRGRKVGSEEEEAATAGSRMTGAYVMMFRMSEHRSVVVGRLGVYDLQEGWYAYVGSAMNGLKARTGRHLRCDGRKRWHIDYVLPLSQERFAFLIPSDTDIECRVADLISSWDGTKVPIKGFGSSDCRCPSHLFLLGSEDPEIGKRLSSGLGKRNVIRENNPQC